jgi:hypothetical protein
MENIKLFMTNTGYFDKGFYEDYIKHNMCKKYYKECKSVFDSEDCIAYTRISFKSKTDSIVEFTSIFILDLSESVPVIVENINTSSGMAMCLCGTDNDCDDDDEDDGLISARDFGEMCVKRVADKVTEYIIDNAKCYDDYVIIKRNKK